ncbi:uncharacterized protein N7529_009358 [Penicillium soppii]|jgi:uncharacterized protein YcbX|uniref:uncharacterized protein n=1 Tax=Penicillium soppii TaxID=69789 RepID=UPI002547818B|nr:uncharacterized protein N7529_009358 [Penicillium soppii]KAJ5855414.1 hypothetical protein N7529_009358 [Penicillium soppii]
MLLQLLRSFDISLSDALIRIALVSIIVLGIGLAVVIQFGNVQTAHRRLRHLERLGSITSNMTDQYDSKFGLPPNTANDGPVRIKSLYLHPVKSCGPIEVDRALLTKTGFMYDRCFALATETINRDNPAASKWSFISQRTKPMMSLIKTELWLPHKESNPYDPLVQSRGCVVMTFEDPDIPNWANRVETFFHTWDVFAKPQVSFIIPLHMTATQIEESQTKLKTFGIHSRDAMGLDLGGVPSITAALPKLKRFLRIPEGQSLTLFRCTPDTLTRTDKNLAPLKHIGTPALHGYTDQQPININSLSSVHAVSALLPIENQPMDALRFRANIWITGAPAFEEETWKRYAILPKSGSTQPRASVAPAFSVVCRTSRCTMPNVDPGKGTFDADIPPPEKKRGKPQPSTTLVQYRTVETGNKAALGYLGMHCVPEDWTLKMAEEQKIGLYVQVGDEIEVLERGTHLYGSTGDDY